MDKQIFKEQLQDLVNVYPNWKIDIQNKKVLLTWYKKLKKIDNNSFKKMVQKYIDKEEFPPTISGLKKYYSPPLKSTVDYEEVSKLYE